MNLDYDKIQTQEEQGEQWASYSDLFMVLSFVFLLLYVVANLKNGTFSIQKQIQLKDLTAKNQDLEEQIRVYNTLKDSYITSQANSEEQQTYEKLMNKLSLLKEETKKEKEELLKKAKDNADKEMALNKYQQIIRNIINANVLAKNRMKRQDGSLTVQKNIIASQKDNLAEKEKIINEKQKIINDKTVEVTNLKASLEEKQNLITQNELAIKDLRSDLYGKINTLKKSQKMSANLKTQIKKMKQEAHRKIVSLKKQNESSQNEIQTISKNLNSAKNQLVLAEKTIEQQEREKQELNQSLARTNAELQVTKDNLENELRALQSTHQDLIAKEKDAQNMLKQDLQKLQQDIEKNKGQYQASINHLKKLHADDMKKTEKQFKQELNELNLNARQKALKLKKHNEDIQKKNQDLENNIANLNNKIAESNQSIQNIKDKLDASASKNQDLNQKLARTSDELKKAQDKIAAKKKIIEKIKDNFAKANMKVEIDEATGDLVLGLGDEYFDTGKYLLKPIMKKNLEKFMPVYASSVFQDKKLAEKISYIEVVGYASPTYQGRYVDPDSLDPNDRQAAQYNLDLSYRRARSIFNYIFDTENLKYNHQKDLLKLVKVTGRSFFTEQNQDRKIASGMTQKEFCQKYDCEKAQKVIVRFALKDK